MHFEVEPYKSTLLILPISSNCFEFSLSTGLIILTSASNIAWFGNVSNIIDNLFSFLSTTWKSLILKNFSSAHNSVWFFNKILLIWCVKNLAPSTATFLSSRSNFFLGLLMQLQRYSGIPDCAQFLYGTLKVK